MSRVKRRGLKKFLGNYPAFDASPDGEPVKSMITAIFPFNVSASSYKTGNSFHVLVVAVTENVQ